MCVWFLALGRMDRFPLILAGNRDEFYARPTRSAQFWEECPGVLAGRDELEKGTWMGVTESGRLALLTNFRDPSAVRPGLSSRGMLVRDFLCREAGAREYAEGVGRHQESYNPFNLLVADGRGMFYVSSRADRPAALPPGIHGLSNALLNTPWPKAEKGKAALAGLCARPPEGAEELAERLFKVLGDTGQADDQDLPDTGVGIELERMLSPVFVRSPGYGTRSQTVLIVQRSGRVLFEERGFDSSPAEGSPAARIRKRFFLHWPTGPGSLLYTYQEKPEKPE
ncbi:MAG: NRDE family protein [Thermodesulfobacteriota bacterium]